MLLVSLDPGGLAEAGISQACVKYYLNITTVNVHEMIPHRLCSIQWTMWSQRALIRSAGLLVKGWFLLLKDATDSSVLCPVSITGHILLLPVGCVFSPALIFQLVCVCVWRWGVGGFIYLSHLKASKVTVTVAQKDIRLSLQCILAARHDKLNIYGEFSLI